LSTSEFIREAIRSKIRTIEHPQYNNGVIKEVKNGLQKQKAVVNHKQREIDMKLGALKEQMRQLKEVSNQKRATLYRGDVERVADVLREEFEATMSEIQNATNIEKEALSKILMDGNLFSTSLNGKYKLKGGSSGGK